MPDVGAGVMNPLPGKLPAAVTDDMPVGLLPA